MELDEVYGRRRRTVAGRGRGPFLRRAAAAALAVVLPILCLGCGRPAPGNGRRIGLCLPCFGKLARWPSPACAVCDRPLPPPVPKGFRCGTCRRHPSSLASWRSAWTYQPPLDSVVRALKFRRLDYLGEQLGSGALEAVRGRLAAVSAVTAVPLHPLRRWARGYDQAVLVARGVATALDLPYYPLLVRSRWTVAQSRLPRERRLLNPLRVFRLRWRMPFRESPSALLARHRWLLVDDVVTTGATLESAARCLVEAGAPVVHGLAVARAPDEDGSRLSGPDLNRKC